MNRYHVGYTIPTFATGWITGALHVYASNAREAERKALESLEDDDAKVVSCYKVSGSDSGTFEEDYKNLTNPGKWGK